MKNRALRDGIEAIVGFIVIVPTVIFVLLVFATLAAISSPIWGPYLVCRHLYVHGRNRGRVFFVVSRRRGWFEFLTNNVLPVLPPNMGVIWFARDHHNASLRNLVAVSSIAKPYVVVVGLWRNKVIQLHNELEPLKRTVRRRDANVLESMRAILGGVMDVATVGPR